jgi:uncharacterized repeat protein (TIGR01451 family)
MLPPRRRTPRFRGCVRLTGTTFAALALILVPCAHQEVSAQSLDSIAVTPTDPTIDVGQNQRFTATGTFSDGSTRVLSGSPLAGGDHHSCALIADGTVQCWGWNQYGQLGNGLNTDSPVPVPVSGITNATAIAAGLAHTCALLADGRVECWGFNEDGQLGNGLTTDSPTPVVVNNIANATAVTAGYGHTCALLGNGSVWCWGADGIGQLGNGSGDDNVGSLTPVQVVGISNSVAIASGGWDHTCALGADGSVWCWGANDAGQLGIARISTLRSQATQVVGLSGATAISVGYSNSCALLADGSVQCWGADESGQIGDGGTTPIPYTTPQAVSGISNARAITTGYAHSCALLRDDTIKCWGAYGVDYWGQVGDGGDTGAVAPVSVSGVTDGMAIEAGDDHTCVVRADSSVWCWGLNDYGQLGDRSGINAPSPVAAIGVPSVTTLRWASSSETVAPVTQNGVALGLISGRTEISATANGITGQTLLTVGSPGPGPTSTFLQAIPDLAALGQPVSFLAQVSGGNPTGTVDVFEGATLLGSGTLSGGVTSFTTSALALGSHQVTAHYNGDAGNAASDSAAVTAKITNAVDLAVTMAARPTAGSVNQPLVYTITVTNNSAFGATGVQLNHSLPSAATFNNIVTTSQGTCGLLNPTLLRCDLGALPATRQAVVNVTVTPTASVALTSTTNVFGAEADLVLANNAATVTTLIDATLILAPIYTQGASYRIVPAVPILSPIYTQGASYRIIPPTPTLSPIFTQGASYRIVPPALTLAPIYTQGASYSIASNTPAGPNQTVALPGGVTVTFANVSVPGNTTIVPIPPSLAGTLPGGFAVFGNLAFEVTTTATVSGPIILTFVVPSAADPLTFATLRVLHGEGGAFVDRTVLAPSTPAPDFPTHRIRARVPSLSPFVIAQIMSHPPVAQCRDAVLAANGACQANVGAADVDAGSFDPDPGDVITRVLDTYGPLGLGPHSVTLTVTDGSGASSSCPATVTVRDMTPPTLVCPANVTAEFTDALGAAVAIGPPATADNCSSTTVTPNPVSGSVFPIGSTAVTWTAADPSGNVATCRSTVVVVGALGVKGDVLADQKALRAGLPRSAVRTGLDLAAGLLQASIDARLWIDQTHPRPATGNGAFVLERDSVATLLAVIQVVRRAGDVPVAASTLAAFVERITRSDRLLAQVAIDDATARHGRASDIARARAKLADGDLEASHDRADRAIDRYREAWALAQKAVTGK